MNKKCFEQIDDLVDNWDGHLDKFHLSFNKMNNWAAKQTLKFSKKYRKKMNNLDLFKKLSFTALYEDSKNGHLISINIDARKDKGKDVKISFFPSIFLKVDPEKEAHNATFKGNHYFLITGEKVMNTSIQVYNENNNINTLIEKLESVEYGRNMRFFHMEAVSIDNAISEKGHSYGFKSYEIDSKGNYENPISQAYTEYIKTTSKKFDLNEKISNIGKSIMGKKEKYPHAIAMDADNMVNAIREEVMDDSVDRG